LEEILQSGLELDCSRTLHRWRRFLHLVFLELDCRVGGDFFILSFLSSDLQRKQLILVI